MIRIALMALLGYSLVKAVTDPAVNGAEWLVFLTLLALIFLPTRRRDVW